MCGLYLYASPQDIREGLLSKILKARVFRLRVCGSRATMNSFDSDAALFRTIFAGALEILRSCLVQEMLGSYRFASDECEIIQLSEHRVCKSC